MSTPAEIRLARRVMRHELEAIQGNWGWFLALGIALIVVSGFRSDAEQAELFAAHPDPKWVAPPGTSLHRCATELDLGPSGAYAWLAARGWTGLVMYAEAALAFRGLMTAEEARATRAACQRPEDQAAALQLYGEAMRGGFEGAALELRAYRGSAALRSAALTPQDP